MPYISKAYNEFANTGKLPTAILLLAVAAFFTSDSIPAADNPPVDLFTDESEKSGLVFHHFNGMSGELFFPEVVGTGAAPSAFSAVGR